jgi:hypothetical protein
MLLFATEFFLRTKPVAEYLNVPYLGSCHRQLETQFARIKLIAEKDGKLDCLFVGNSMVWFGINPEQFTDSYKNMTGEEIVCFNFGVSAMPAVAAGVVTEILVNEYHPKMVIYGTSARDYAIPLDAEDSSVILETPWVQYKSGNLSLTGWLYAHSYFYGHLWNLNRLFHLDQTVFTDIGLSRFDRSGFLPKVGKAKEDSNQVALLDAQKWLLDYQIQPENVNGLENIANYSKQGIQVIFFEAPVLDTYYDSFGNGKDDYDKFVNVVSDVSKEYGIPFIRTNELTIFPEDGWWNNYHFNWVGADIFSRWLGEQIGLLHN